MTTIEWTDELQARFWGYVDKRGPDECWPWKAGRFERGYGQFRLGKRKVKAHRCAYELTNGPLGDGMKALHKCDNPPCCNPHHLFEGTNKDNTSDMYAKGRAAPLPRTSLPGAANPAAKLTPETVLEIRKLARAGEQQRAIAARFGLSQSQIGNVVRGDCWKDGPWPQ